LILRFYDRIGEKNADAGSCEGFIYRQLHTSVDYVLSRQATCCQMEGDSVADVVRVQVLMKPAEAARFERYCDERGHKKSTLIARLVREHLDREECAPARGAVAKGAQ
jgi:hypothetical protein